MYGKTVAEARQNDGKNTEWVWQNPSFDLKFGISQLHAYYYHRTIQRKGKTYGICLGRKAAAGRYSLIKCPQGNLSAVELWIQSKGERPGRRGYLFTNLDSPSTRRSSCAGPTLFAKVTLNPAVSPKQNNVRKDMNHESSQNLTCRGSGCFNFMTFGREPFCKVGGTLQSVFAQKLILNFN